MTNWKIILKLDDSFVSATSRTTFIDLLDPCDFLIFRWPYYWTSCSYSLLCIWVLSQTTRSRLLAQSYHVVWFRWLKNVYRQNVQHFGLLEVDKTWIPKPNGPPNHDQQINGENVLEDSRACGNPALILEPRVHPSMLRWVYSRAGNLCTVWSKTITKTKILQKKLIVSRYTGSHL